MNLVLPILNVFVMALVVYRSFRRQPDFLKRIFLPAMMLKLVAGIALGGLYIYHYGAGDTISFWKDGVQLADGFLRNPGEGLTFLWNESLAPELHQQFSNQGPRSLFFVKISGLLALISSGHYWTMGAWLSLASFAASWLLFSRLCRFFPDMKVAHALAILLFPSVVFWSAGLIKESLGLAALYVISATVLSLALRHKVTILELCLVVVALWVGWNLKYYWLGIFLPVALPVAMVAGLVRWKGSLARYDLMLWLFLFLACISVATHVHPNFYVSRFLDVICQNNLEFTRLSDPPRLVQYFNLEPEVMSMLVNTPAALIAGLFRPFVWEAFNTLSWLAALENLVILLVVVQALPGLGKAIRSEHRVLLIAGLTYTLVLIAFLSLSTPNFGTLSRYRIGALPFLLLVCLTPSTPLGRWLGGRRWFG